ncbi:MAG: hypothetical protein J6S14_12715 [Clostridia bacterium]|nr:hypothetical protein [Clostridia bacterium]
MKVIQELSEMIEEEIEGAEEYAKGAVHFKESNPTLAKTFYDISVDEVKHIGLLHEEVKKIIEAHRKEHGEPPAAMIAVYDYLHKKHMEKVSHIKVMQGEYRSVP